MLTTTGRRRGDGGSPGGTYFRPGRTGVEIALNDSSKLSQCQRNNFGATRIGLTIGGLCLANRRNIRTGIPKRRAASSVRISADIFRSG